jgi:hypothetical protein
MIDCSISSRLSELGNLEKGNNQWQLMHQKYQKY